MRLLASLPRRLWMEATSARARHSSHTPSMKGSVGKTIAKSAARAMVLSSASAPRLASGVAQQVVEFELPASFRAEQPALCRAVAVANQRCFGPFAEKTLECNPAARAAIDQMCYEGGFTQAWAPGAAADGFMTMTKIPVIVPVSYTHLTLPTICSV